MLVRLKRRESNSGMPCDGRTGAIAAFIGGGGGCAIDAASPGLAVGRGEIGDGGKMYTLYTAETCKNTVSCGSRAATEKYRSLLKYGRYRI